MTVLIPLTHGRGQAAFLEVLAVYTIIKKALYNPQAANEEAILQEFWQTARRSCMESGALRLADYVTVKNKTTYQDTDEVASLWIDTWRTGRSTATTRPGASESPR
mmetsp:Transcript_46632/g.143993  ORF Transcript_46632/g.143993 Transcript_46632/m.143993 type:complete len:106 (+) Transcript_46632:69-386(+)|eukprot:CAMPEP_0204554764 /NCGR_PEP_ID=MMETSP0661-20131031/28350_1 /ASSEMBLY_ACC=CAM_ASM_000606 /TAXON_ID=109239 /ORGANISM="Alexandrium margalefi, Strain AMGDE01CS-322" /LENGTH=105 /DNA_ID=CAMNT_0051561841 /DNA_START=54 /DNA_END=371 /DNA_ORIENTATION=-